MAQTLVLLATFGAAACRAADSASPAADPPTSADFEHALADGSPFTLEYEWQSRPRGPSLALSIAADGTCEGSTEARGGDEPRRRSGRLSAADRATVIEALRDAPFHELDLTREGRGVMDGTPVRLVVTVGGRRREVERQMGELRFAGLGPLCSTLDAVVEGLEPR